MLRACSQVARPRINRSFATLVIADCDAASGLGKSTLSAITAAKKWEKGTLSILCTDDKSAGEAAKFGNVYVADGAKTADKLCDAVEKLHAKDKYTHVIGPSGSTAKDVLPRFAAKIDVQPISDIMTVEDDSTFKRPMYAGNAIATVKLEDPVKVMTVRTTSFPPAEPSGDGKVEKIDAADGSMKWVSDSEKANDDKPKLGTANRVISGGRGLASGENFEQVLQPMCDAFNAALGASRAAVDAGYVPNELQVGQTGKNVAPDLYIAVGISGAIQHLAGMKDSKTIVAINKDRDAPIFTISDYGLVGDLFELVPEATKKIKE